MVNGVKESRLTMTKTTCSHTRVLKVEEVGDFYRKRTKPYLRLMGVWLQRAGIQPNNHVRIDNPEPGILVISVQSNNLINNQ